MSKPRGFWEVGKWLQQTANTAQEAAKRLNDSCTKCKYAAVCNNEHKCPIYKEYELRLLTLDVGKPMKRQFEFSTRKYKKATPEVKMKKALLNFLTRFYNACTHYDTKVILDDVSVFVEMREYGMGLYVLQSNHMPKAAAKYQEIMQRYQ